MAGHCEPGACSSWKGDVWPLALSMSEFQGRISWKTRIFRVCMHISCSFEIRPSRRWVNNDVNVSLLLTRNGNYINLVCNYVGKTICLTWLTMEEQELSWVLCIVYRRVYSNNWQTSNWAIQIYLFFYYFVINVLIIKIYADIRCWQMFFCLQK